MAARQRPAGPGAQVSDEDTAQAAAVLASVLADLSAAHAAAVQALTGITHPVERARAAMLVRRATTGSLALSTDDVFEAAVVEAYTRGKQSHGWYGYGALADQLGLSRARVQQVVNGTWRAKQPSTTTSGQSPVQPSSK